MNLDEFYVNETTDLMIMPLLPNYSSSLPPSDIYNTDPEESFAISLSFWSWREVLGYEVWSF